MNGSASLPIGRPVLAAILAVWCLAGVGLLADDDPDSPWSVLGERSRAVLSLLVPAPHTGARGATTSLTLPRTIVVGFTGGREGRDSDISGVVRLRRRIEEARGDRDDVVALTFNNRNWRPAARDVVALAGRAAAAPGVDRATVADDQPLIIAYGHSWGAGAVTKFARLLGDVDLDVALAVYIDAFSLRNPRVPANVRYAVNFYQRTGIFRGFPLRGKSKLILESPESTIVLANLRITPDTEHFGWHWNLLQPLLYRHHHRMGHDVRLQQYLLDVIAMVPAGDDATRTDGSAGNGPPIAFLPTAQTLEAFD